MTKAADAPPRQLSNLQLRVVSAVVLAAVVLVLTWFGGWPFRLLCAGIAAAIFYEWCAMSRTADNANAQRTAGLSLGIALVLLVMGWPANAVFGMTLIVAAGSAAVGHIWVQSYWPAMGIAYAGLAGASLAFLRGNDNAGLVAVLFLFAVVWATDIFAYFVGRRIGGPKLAPKISPGKTRSGAVGGAVGGVAAGLLVALAAGAGNLPVLALVALVLSIVAQAGDLFESWLKRRHGLKDSGHIIPGHGGVMDRVDGLVAAALALYLLGLLSGSADNPAQGLFAM